MILKTASLPGPIRSIVQNKETEKPFSGEYDDFGESGTYLCRQCGLALFRSTTKFHSGCGWPSFDEEITRSIEQKPDSDGQRTEILCARCHAHLGHLFKGERFTVKDARYCINSLSLDFVTDLTVEDTEEAILAAGCFWGVEYWFKQLPGVIKTEVGYTGGHKENPTYTEVCNNTTGHYEAIRVLYDPSKLNFADVVKFFFEIHNPAQLNGQGPDHGERYLSAIFYYDDTQKKIAVSLMNVLINKGYQLVTKLLPVATFWRAEKYHQDYYAKTGKQPYCHFYQKKFEASQPK